MEVKCKCEYCKKDIRVDVPAKDYYNSDFDCSLGNACNNCIPENSCARDGMVESTYTETKVKVLFLDVDGVLNGYNKWTYLIVNTSRFLHIPTRFVSRRLKIFEPKEKYVKRLSKIINRTGAKIVMSSSWRYGFWNTPYEEKHWDQKKLHDLLEKYSIEVIDITPSSRNGKREDEIIQWLSETNIRIDKFVILDDESYDLQSFVDKELVKTSKVIEGNMIRGLPYEDTGLKNKHAKQAIKILNN
jgi:hypothetical protein